jgi:hypothetical protein
MTSCLAARIHLCAMADMDIRRGRPCQTLAVPDEDAACGCLYIRLSWRIDDIETEACKGLLL